MAIINRRQFVGSLAIGTAEPWQVECEPISFGPCLCLARPATATKDREACSLTTQRSEGRKVRHDRLRTANDLNSRTVRTVV